MSKFMETIKYIFSQDQVLSFVTWDENNIQPREREKENMRKRTSTDVWKCTALDDQ